MTLNMTAWGEEKRRVVSQAMITISLDDVKVLRCGRYIDIRAGNEVFSQSQRRHLVLTLRRYAK